MAAIIVSGIILKKTKMFAGDPAPFVMELPAYHLPDTRQRSPFNVGARLVLHQESRHNHPSFHNPRLVHHLLRISRLTVHSVCSAEDEIDAVHPRCYRRRNRMDFRASRLGYMAGSSCVHYRSCCEGKHRWYDGYSLRRRPATFTRHSQAYSPA